MITLSQVLEWKYGPVAGTMQKDPEDMSPNPKMIISSWNHPDIEQPNEAQLKIDFKEYKKYLSEKNKKKEIREKAKKAIMDKYRNKKNPVISNADATQMMKLKMAEELESEL